MMLNNSSFEQYSNIRRRSLCGRDSIDVMIIYFEAGGQGRRSSEQERIKKGPTKKPK